MNETPNSGSPPDAEAPPAEEPTPPEATPPETAPPPEAAPPPPPGTPWAPPEPSGPRFGGFWIRFAAYIIDGLLLGLISIPLGILSYYAATQQAGAASGLIYLLGFVISIGYFVVFWVRGGATPGMRALGLQVVRDADGGPLTWGRGILRYIGLIISALVLYIGLIWVAFDSRKRGWHDLIAGTVVIRRPDVPITGGRKVLMVGAIGCGCLLPFIAVILVVTALVWLGPLVGQVLRGDDGQVSQPVVMPMEFLEVGDCFDLNQDGAEFVTTVRVIPCSDPHVYELFFVGDMPDGAWPGEDAVTSFVDDQCTPAFEDYVGIAYLDSQWYAFFFGPDEDLWTSGSRTIWCQLHNADETPVTGSARGSNQ